MRRGENVCDDCVYATGPTSLARKRNGYAKGQQKPKMARKATVGLRIRRRELSSELPQAGAWRPKNDLMLAKRASMVLRMLRFDEQRSNLPRQNYGDLLCLCAV